MIKLEFEGCDGSGKTTGLKYFVDRLNDFGKTVLETREVGSPLIPTNVKLREIVLSPDSDLSGKAMEMVFSAMRFENDRLYKSVGNLYDYIVSDRGWLSHLSYTDHNVNEEFTKGLYLNFMQNETSLPDVVVYFAVDTQTALARRVNRSEAVDVIEAKGVGYQELVRQSFEKYIDQLVDERPNTKVFIINANLGIEEVQTELLRVVHMLHDPKIPNGGIFKLGYTTQTEADVQKG